MLELDRTLTLLLNGSDSAYLDGVAWIATQTATWIPLAALLLFVLYRRYSLAGFIATVAAVALCITLADQVASGIFKPWVARLRPSHDPALAGLIDTVGGYRGGLYGFFSSHAANTMAVAVFVSLVVRYRPLTAGLISWSLLNCWTRVYLGVHFVGDLTVGLLWGTTVGLLVYFIWKRYAPGVQAATPASNPSPSERNALLTASGFTFSAARLLVAGLLLSYLYVLIAAAFR